MHISIYHAFSVCYKRRNKISFWVGISRGNNYVTEKGKSGWLLVPIGAGWTKFRGGGKGNLYFGGGGGGFVISWCLVNILTKKREHFYEELF